jgi:hypothetical protein
VGIRTHKRQSRSRFNSLDLTKSLKLTEAKLQIARDWRVSTIGLGVSSLSSRRCSALDQPALAETLEGAKQELKHARNGNAFARQHIGTSGTRALTKMLPIASYWMTPRKALGQGLQPQDDLKYFPCAKPFVRQCRFRNVVPYPVRVRSFWNSGCSVQALA